MIGKAGMEIVDDMIKKLSSEPAWDYEVRVDHIYTWVMLEFCNVNEIKTLEQVLLERKGHMFCSTIKVGPCREFFDVERATSVLEPSFDFDRRVEFQYTTKRVRADTLKSRLQTGSTISVVALLHEADDQRLVFDPLIMGFPHFTTDDTEWRHALLWSRGEFGQNYLEDFDEFSVVSDHPLPKDFSAMENVPEIGVKRALAKVLVDNTTKDWGGETSDHFTSHLHLGGRRVSGAFLLKGPANFHPMTIRHLGTNGDQIVRLATEPADVLFVQHCHDITPAVITMLRAMAVQPGRLRRYCCIDGSETLRFLQAFDLYDFACAQSS